MLIKGAYATELESFLLNVNKLTVEDAGKAIKEFAEQEENRIYKAIRSVTITIPVGFIQVAGTAGVSTNLTPIVLNNAIS